MTQINYLSRHLSKLTLMEIRTDKMNFVHLRLFLLLTIVTSCSGEGGVESGKIYSKEAGSDTSFKYDTSNPKDITADLRETLQTLAPVKMYTAQKEVARYLKYAYLSLAGHPEQAIKDITADSRETLQTLPPVKMYTAQKEVARYLKYAYLSLAEHTEQAIKVRLIALEAKFQHMLSSDLMDKFKVNAARIVETFIPLIYDAHIILKNETLVVRLLDQIIEMAEEMKEESGTARDNNKKISRNVNQIIADVIVWNKHVVEEQERIRDEIDIEKMFLNNDVLAQEELKEECQRQDNVIEVLTLERDMWREKANMAVQGLNGYGRKTFLDYTPVPEPAIAGGLAGVYNLEGLNFSSDRRVDEIKVLMDAHREAQSFVEQAHDQKRDILSRYLKQQKQTLERERQLKKKKTELANFGDVQSLFDASFHLGEVEAQLTRTTQIWSHFANSLKDLKSDIEIGKSHLGVPDNPKYTERFLSSMGRAQQGWDLFRNVCAAYVKASDKEINSLYSFLAEPIYNMAAEKRAERQRIILQEIQADIDMIYPEQD